MISRSSMEGYASCLILNKEDHEKYFFNKIEDIYANRGEFFANSFFDLLFPYSENISLLI